MMLIILPAAMSVLPFTQRATTFQSQPGGFRSMNHSMTASSASVASRNLSGLTPGSSMSVLRSEVLTVVVAVRRGFLQRGNLPGGERRHGVLEHQRLGGRSHRQVNGQVDLRPQRLRL